MDYLRKNLVFLIWPFAVLSAQASRIAGRVVRLSGEVTLSNAKIKAHAPMVGDTLVEGDVIDTGENGRVKISMIDGGNEVVVGARTHLVIERVGSLSRGQGGTTLRLDGGEVRSNVKRKYTGLDGDVFEVKTPNAVAGVRGTVFWVAYDARERESLLATEAGAVMWKSKVQEFLVSQGKYSLIAGPRAVLPAPIDGNPGLKQRVRSFTEQSDELERPANPASSASAGGDSRSTGFDADGDEIVVENSTLKGSSGRSPASVSGPVDAGEGRPVATPRKSLGEEEKKLALSKLEPGSVPAPTSPSAVLDQRGLCDQVDFVNKNVKSLSPPVVSAPVK